MTASTSIGMQFGDCYKAAHTIVPTAPQNVEGDLDFMKSPKHIGVGCFPNNLIPSRTLCRPCMGQQQILFLILALCIAGIAVSAFAIVDDSETDFRAAIHTDLTMLAARAREFRDTPFEADGGDGTFIGLTATPQGFERLAGTMSRTYARYFISKSGNSRSVEVTAVGLHPGNDSQKPVRIIMTVFAESTAIRIVN